jgi:hypothetical protein
MVVAFMAWHGFHVYRFGCPTFLVDCNMIVTLRVGTARVLLLEVWLLWLRMVADAAG